MVAFDRRFDIIVYIIRHRSATATELKNRFGVADSTIRSDMDALSLFYPITSIQGKGGGYRYIGKEPMFIRHIEMLEKVSEEIVKIGGIEGYNSVLMRDTIKALMTIEVHGNHSYL